ncbi:hypothetical protein P170DRAFT_239444 [Aspergillus steynii IBT 23096]|uniref:MIT domain-containing protein n=1 Tax=Aspergillus steynii IBT 23096 TaxID=1392250 RepID=A0A2I2G394_9EURO|nr:uncharacterized protein P170DRAFT_239444 [Aspergillus steynii IBT 23096]PLB47353.1 hypothetical protein P170DRAFT_239444 [Aspergillus steynii IBT 23096]
MADETDFKSDLYKVSVSPFVLERNGQYDNAITAYRNATEILDVLVKKLKKSTAPKINRKMFERQIKVHSERLVYLEGLKAKGSFDSIVLPPTVLDAVAELEATEGPRTLTQGLRKEKLESSPAPAHLQALLNPNSEQIPFFSPTLDPSMPPITYRITHSSELVALGMRSHWYFVKDASNTHVLYGLQFVWSDSVPIVNAVLRRAGEFLPGMGAVGVRLRKTPGGSFRVETTTLPDIGAVMETPDGAKHRKDWSPRRFTYGGRNFVWKSGEKRMFNAFSWETLYETKRVWAKEGSQTGKMEDETVGPRLCWGEKKGGSGADHTIYMAHGLDIYFREHLLAVQLARLARTSYPPAKDTSGVEAVGAGFALVGFLEAIS